MAPIVTSLNELYDIVYLLDILEFGQIVHSAIKAWLKNIVKSDSKAQPRVVVENINCYFYGWLHKSEINEITHTFAGSCTGVLYHVNI